MIPPFWGRFLVPPRVAREEERAGHFAALAERSNFPRATEHSPPFYKVSPFVPPQRDYSGSAAIPKENGSEALLFSPMRKTAISPVAYRRLLLSD